MTTTNLGVKGIKLVTNEELFGQTEILSDGRFKITNPVALRMVPSQIQGGAPSMAFVPFPQMASEKSNSLLIEPLHIVYQYTPYTELVSEYNNLVEDGKGTPQIITG